MKVIDQVFVGWMFDLCCLIFWWDQLGGSNVLIVCCVVGATIILSNTLYILLGRYNRFC